MLTYQAFFQNELQKRIRSEIDRLKDNLVSAHLTIDHPAYKYQVGVITGLKEALELIEETESMINGAERG